MEDLEEVFSELTRFESGRQQEIPGVLERYLKHVARTGDSVFPWPKVRPLLKRKLDVIADQYCQHSPPEKIPAMPNVDPFKYDQLKQEIHARIDSLAGTPFTIQRLCELVTEPQRFYKRTDKLMRGIEKNVLVVTTIEATRSRRPPGAEVLNGAAGPTLWAPLDVASTSGSSPRKPVVEPAPTSQTADSVAMETNGVAEGDQRRPQMPEISQHTDEANGEAQMEVEVGAPTDDHPEVSSVPSTSQTEPEPSDPVTPERQLTVPSGDESPSGPESSSGTEVEARETAPVQQASAGESSEIVSEPVVKDSAPVPAEEPPTAELEVAPVAQPDGEDGDGARTVDVEGAKELAPLAAAEGGGVAAAGVVEDGEAVSAAACDESQSVPAVAAGEEQTSDEGARPESPAPHCGESGEAVATVEATAAVIADTTDASQPEQVTVTPDASVDSTPEEEASEPSSEVPDSTSSAVVASDMDDSQPTRVPVA